MVLAVVWLAVNYALLVWYLRSADLLIKLLYNMQRTSIQAIICLFGTVVLPIAEAEAGVEQLCQRLLDQCLQFWISIYMLNNSHLLAALLRACLCRRFFSLIQEIAVRFSKVNTGRVATINLVAVALWMKGMSSIDLLNWSDFLSVCEKTR